MMNKILVSVLLSAVAFAQNPNTAVFPTTAATDSDLMVASDRARTTLSSAITDSTLSLPVVSSTRFTPPMIVTIGSEQIKICSKSVGYLTVCSGGRGFSGTVAAAASSGAAVTGNVVSYLTNQLSAEVKAIESLLKTGTNGHFLTLSSGVPAWAVLPACATCVVTSGSYADPAWITSLAGSKISGNISGNAGTATALAANGANCAAGTFPLGVDASGASESCTALPTTISGTANQITASASTGAITLSLPTTINGLSSVTSTAFVGSLTGNASTASALASTVASGRLWIGNGTGAPTSDSVICADTTNHRVGVGTCTPSTYGHFKGANIPNIGQVLIEGTGIAQITFYDGGTQKGQIYHQTSDDTFQIRNAVSGGSIQFYAQAGHLARFAATTGNFLLAGTTDRNYKLLVNSSGSAGTVGIVDTTATTGFTLADFGWDGLNTSATYTKVRVRAGASQGSNNLQEWVSNAGSTIASVNASGGMSFTAIAAVSGGAFALDTGSLNAGSGLKAGSGSGVFWNNAAAVTSSNPDLSLTRSAANTLQVGDGGANANGTVSAAVGRFTNTASNVIVSGSSGQTPGILFNQSAIGNMSIRSRASVSDIEIINDSSVRIFSFGQSGIVTIYNETPTTGVTKQVIRAGAGQSTTNLTEWQNNAGSAVAVMSSGGQLTLSAGLYLPDGYGVAWYDGSTVINGQGNGTTSDYVGITTNGTLAIRVNGSQLLQFMGTTSSFPALKRSSAILQARLADDSAYTDIQVSSIITKQTTPSASTDACTAGALWADASYIYACTASGTIKRATLATF